jgi:hypothetical protein
MVCATGDIIKAHIISKMWQNSKEQNYDGIRDILALIKNWKVLDFNTYLKACINITSKLLEPVSMNTFQASVAENLKHYAATTLSKEAFPICYTVSVYGNVYCVINKEMEGFVHKHKKKNSLVYHFVNGEEALTFVFSMFYKISIVYENDFLTHLISHVILHSRTVEKHNAFALGDNVYLPFYVATFFPVTDYEVLFQNRTSKEVFKCQNVEFNFECAISGEVECQSWFFKDLRSVETETMDDSAKSKTKMLCGSTDLLQQLLPKNAVRDCY